MKKYYCTVCDWVYDPEKETPRTASPPAQPLKTCRQTGFAPSAVLERTCLKKFRNKPGLPHTTCRHPHLQPRDFPQVVNRQPFIGTVKAGQVDPCPAFTVNVVIKSFTTPTVRCVKTLKSSVFRNLRPNAPPGKRTVRPMEKRRCRLSRVVRERCSEPNRLILTSSG